MTYFLGSRGSKPLSYHGGQIYISWNNLESPIHMMGPAIASSDKFLPCILKKMKCKYFLQSIPNHPPPPRASKWGHRSHSQVWTTVILDLKMHLYTLWFGCTTSTSREDNVLKLQFFGPWAPVLGPPWGPDAPVKQLTCPFSHELLFFWILYLKYLNMYFPEEEIQIFLLGPLVNLYAPPPFLRGLAG